MIFRKPESRLRRRRFERRNWGAAAVPSLERLENRCLLAGDVTASLRGQSAFVNGDAADNSVELAVENGDVVLRGLDGTTINGSSDTFVLIAGSTAVPRNLYVALGNGNDTFNMIGVSVGGSVVIDAGAGSDDVAVSNGSEVGGRLVINGRGGDDTLTLQGATVNGHVILRGHQGNNQITVSGSSLQGDLRAHGGRGNDNIVVDASTIARDAWITGWRGDDDIVLRNSTIGDDLRAVGHAGDDIIMIDATTVADRSHILGHRGNDNVLVQNGSQLSGRTRIIGHGGVDHVEIDATSSTGRLRSRRFSTATADADAVATRITDSTTGALAAAEAAVARVDLSSTLTLTVSNTSVDEGAGVGASTVTATLSAALDEDVEITFSSSNAARLSLQQTSVTITAGATTADVLLDPLNNSDVDGDAVVTISATSTIVGDASVTVTVVDDDAPTSSTLTLTPAESSVVEDTGDASTVGAANQLDFVLARSEASSDAETFGLSYRFADGSDAAAFVSGPDTVTIPANETQVSYQLTTVPDGDVRTNDQVTVTAENPVSGTTTATFTLVDNDQPQLDVVFAAPTVDESGTSVSITVSRNTDTTTSLSVDLTSSNAARANFGGDGSTSLEIPAGSTSATQTFDIVDDAIVNGDVNIAVTATASGFVLGTDTVAITDNDAPELSVALGGSGSVGETAGVNAVTGAVTRNSGDLSTPLTVSLSTDDERLSVPSTVTIPAAQSSVNFSVDVIDNSIVDDSNGVVTVTASSAGFADATTTINVVNDDIATFSFSPSVFDVNENDGTTQLTLTRNSSADSQDVNLAYSDTALITGPSTVTFAQGANTTTFTITIIDNSSPSDNADVTVSATSGANPVVEATVRIANDDILTLTTDFSSNVMVESVEAFVTKQDAITVTGQTLPNATVQLDTNGNAVFDEGATVADGDGNYSITVGLTHDDTNNGLNQIQLRAVVADAGAITTSDIIDVHRAVGTVLRFETNQDIDADGENDFYDIELLDADAPNTVANFLQYVEDGSFANNIVHRSISAFVIQGGGFRVDGSTVTRITTRAPIDEEFSADNSNLRGTLSMAHAGHLTGTSQWFVNVQDNVSLDTNVDSNGQSAPHTVFGRVIGGGMNVVDQINSVSTADLNLVQGFSETGPLTTVPLRNSPFRSLTGTVSITADSDVLTGTGTVFTSELNVGDVLISGSSRLIITSISSDTELTIDVQAAESRDGLQLTYMTPQEEDNFILFSNIGKILDTV